MRLSEWVFRVNLARTIKPKRWPKENGDETESTETRELEGITGSAKFSG